MSCSTQGGPARTAFLLAVFWAGVSALRSLFDLVDTGFGADSRAALSERVLPCLRHSLASPGSIVNILASLSACGFQAAIGIRHILVLSPEGFAVHGRPQQTLDRVFLRPIFIDAFFLKCWQKRLSCGYSSFRHRPSSRGGCAADRRYKLDQVMNIGVNRELRYQVITITSSELVSTAGIAFGKRVAGERGRLGAYATGNLAACRG